MRLDRDAESRLDTAVAKGELTQEGREAYLRDEGEFGASRLDNLEGGSTILYSPTTTMTGMVEDYIEGALHKAVKEAEAKLPGGGRAFKKAIAGGAGEGAQVYGHGLYFSSAC